MLKEKSRRVRMSTESMPLVERMPDPPPKIAPEPNAEGTTVSEPVLPTVSRAEMCWHLFKRASQT